MIFQRDHHEFSILCLTCSLLHSDYYFLSDLDAEAIVRIVNDIADPADAARALVKASAALWAEKNDYCDDITAVVIFISGNDTEIDSSGGAERPVEFYHGSKQKSSRASPFRSMFRRLVKRKGRRVKGADETLSLSRYE